MVTRGSKHTGIPTDHGFFLCSLLELLIVTGNCINSSLVGFDYR